MRFLYAFVGILVFGFLLEGIAPAALEEMQITSDAGWISLAIVFAGGLAGGD